jgi:DNA-binding MarR family transcriptional regulator
VSASALPHLPAWERAANALRFYAKTGQLGLTVYDAATLADELTHREPLTRRQAEIVRFIAAYRDANGCAPSFEEIAQEFGFASLATVHEHLTNLEMKGWITRAYNEARAITVVEVPHG